MELLPSRWINCPLQGDLIGVRNLGSEPRREIKVLRWWSSASRWQTLSCVKGIGILFCFRHVQEYHILHVTWRWYCAHQRTSHLMPWTARIRRISRDQLSIVLSYIIRIRPVMSCSHLFSSGIKSCVDADRWSHVLKFGVVSVSSKGEEAESDNPLL